MNKIRICNTLAYIFILFIIILVFPFTITKLFGYTPYGIISNSMEPEIPVGSVIYVKDANPKDIQKDDIITFTVSAANNNVATHRVVLNDTKNQQFITKGDNNAEIDTNPVSYQNFLGKVTLCVPLLGYVYKILISFYGMMLCGILLITAIVLWYLVSQWKKEMKTAAK